MESYLGLSSDYREICIILLWMAVVLIVYVEYVFVKLLEAFVAQWVLLLCVLPVVVSQFDRLGALKWPLAVTLPLVSGCLMFLAVRKIKGQPAKRLNLMKQTSKGP